MPFIYDDGFNDRGAYFAAEEVEHALSATKTNYTKVCFMK